MMKPGRGLDAKIAEAMGYTVIWADHPVSGQTPYIHDESARKIEPHLTEARLPGGHWEILLVGNRVVEVFVRLVPPFSTDDHEALALLKLEPMTLIPVQVYPDFDSFDKSTGSPQIKWVALDWEVASFEGPAPEEFRYLYEGPALDCIDEIIDRDQVRDTMALAICEMFLKRRGVKGGIIGIEEQVQVTHDDWEHILSRLQKKPPQD